MWDSTTRMGKSKECIYPADRGWKPPLYAKSRCAKTGLYIPDEPHNHRKYLPRHGLCQDLPDILLCFKKGNVNGSDITKLEEVDLYYNGTINGKYRNVVKVGSDLDKQNVKR